MDEFVFALKIILILISIIMVSKGNLNGVLLFGVAGFLAGFEQTIGVLNDNPWAYLVAGNASGDELFRATFSGALFAFLPFLIFLICQKDLMSLMGSTQASDKKQENTPITRQ